MDHLIVVGTSLAFYSCLNVVFTLNITAPEHLSNKLARDYIGQHISLVHSVIACILSLRVYLQEGIDYESDFTYPYIFVLGHSLGYFTYDMVYAEIFGVHDLPMRFHHVCVIIGGFSLYTQDKGGSIGALCLVITELSNPFMQLRLIMKTLKKDNTPLYTFIEVGFMFIFIFNRY
jgi:TLC domain